MKQLDIQIVREIMKDEIYHEIGTCVFGSNGMMIDTQYQGNKNGTGWEDISIWHGGWSVKSFFVVTKI